jgi:UDP-N-acetylglucosamine 1-carboxyvinyltransferase
VAEESSALRINGPTRLSGEVAVTGAKNSALKLMAASLLAPGKNTLYNVPQIKDVEIMSELLTRLGCYINFNPASHTMVIEVPQKPGHKAEYELVRKMRASINVLGPILTRTGIAEISLPGGDAIGLQPLPMGS